MAETDIILSCRDLSVGYINRTVLSDMNFDFPAGTMTVLIGANGSGKSTLLRTLAGQQPPLHGEIKLAGRSLRDFSTPELAKARAIVGTSRSGGGGLSVEEAVSVGRYGFTGWTGMMKREDRRIVTEAMVSVGIDRFRSKHLANLSDGERQKVMIARALAQQTTLLILDEPTAFLDVAARIEIMSLLHKLASEGRAVILSTHDIAPSVAQADMILAIEPEKGSAILEKKEKMFESGALDRVFSKAGLRFDPVALDFR